ncbi:MAG: ribosome recycling factor [Thermoguttaceae bacterium]|nr:ribosome recycling factor [Thermoguttaceae bacterium]MDO4857838.1 ribosome recycling factor [Thermoguttaceae bacterium]
MTDDILLDVEERMEKAVARLKSNLAGIRTGRANPGLVDSLKVDAYGSQCPLKQLASVGCPEPTQIVIRPYDPSTLKDISKAIINSDLGFAPQDDGKVIRLNIPPLSQETRRKLVSRIGDLKEEAKVSLRNIRRDGVKACDKGEKDKLFSENDRDAAKEEIDNLIKKFEKEINSLADAREKDVLES